MKSRALLLGLFLTTAAAAVPVHAQAQDGPPDFAEMRQRMMDRMKETIGVTDDEWKAMQPKIEKIQQLQRDVYPRGMGMMMGPAGGGDPGGGAFRIGPGGPGGPGGPPPEIVASVGGSAPSDVQEKLHDLRTALEDKATAPEELKAKADAYRQAKAAAKVELAKAQDDLHQLVTKPTQEAALLSMGILE
jgi:outer membrane murein-binding lipoprotein Lpp